jgi:capsule biosynthesis phosphatase
MKRIIIDLDGTLTVPSDHDYANAEPNHAVIDKLHSYKAAGFDIAIHTSRNMRTHQGNIGKITALTLPIILDWLARHDVPYDEVYVGKPWCGNDGFYVDDRAIRPSEFVSLSPSQIDDLINAR